MLKKFSEFLGESATADAAADIADHHGVSAKSAGVGFHSVSHKPAAGFFDHAGAHEPLTKAGWKLKQKLTTDHGKGEGGVYAKGDKHVKVVTRHNAHQNTVVHSISDHKE